jgi:predicted DNA-binding protein
MPLFTLKLSFLMSDALMKRLDSLAREVGQPRDKVVSDILEMHINELSGLAVAILNKGLNGWEKMKQEKGGKR